MFVFYLLFPFFCKNDFDSFRTSNVPKDRLYVSCCINSKIGRRLPKLLKDFPLTCSCNLCWDLKGKEHLKIKVGHGGTLDFGATGVLVIGINLGCKVLTHFLHGNKTYLVSGKFGEATDTYNNFGKVTHRCSFDHITHSKCLHSLSHFHGNIMQIPPHYSALKKNGKRLSDLIRNGITVHIPPRPVNCYKVECISFNLPYFTLLISCGSGFYVRSLVHDLGIDLNSYAHVTNLCRIQQEPLQLEDCLSMEKLNLEHILHACHNVQLKYSDTLSSAQKQI